MLKRAVSKPPRLFILKPHPRALGADGSKPLASFVLSGVVEVEPARVEVVRPRAGRVRMQAAGPRAS